jgi:hypothetical protein
VVTDVPASTSMAATARDRGRAARLEPAAVAPWIAAVGVGILAFGLSLWRLMPGLGFWDTAEFQLVPPVLGTAHPTGYPTYVVLGWLGSALLAPVGEPALRMNVLSALLVAVGTGFTVDLARRLSGSLLLGVVAGAAVTVTPIVWAIGTHADPHALHYALVAAILWLLVRWEQGRRRFTARASDEPRQPDPEVATPAAAGSANIGDPRTDRLLVAAAVLVGLSVGNHSLTLLLGLPIIAFVLAADPGVLRRPRFVAACIAAFLIPTVLIRLEMVLRAGWFRAPFVYADPSTWDGFWYVTLGAQFHDWVTDPFADPAGRLLDVVTYANAQFGILAPVILVGLAVAVVRQPRWALLSGLTMAITLFFNSVYPDGAIDRYYIVPILLAWTWLAILGATAVELLTGSDRAAGDPTGAGTVAGSSLIRPIALGAVAVLLVAPSVLAIPQRARAVDRSGDRGARVWTDEVLAAVEPNAVIVSWWSYSTPLWYATIVERRRPDICVVDDRNRVDYNLLELSQVIDRYLMTRPVYLVRNGTSELPALEGRYDVQSVGAPTAANLLRVLPLDGTAAPPASAPVPDPLGAAADVAPRELCR